MPGLLGLGDASKDRLSALLENLPADVVRALDGITYCPPVWNAGKIICVGLNYEDHAAETKLDKPDYPILFLRVATTLVGHEQPLVAPKASEQLDYEAEMVVVIGSKGRNIARGRGIRICCWVFGFQRRFRARFPIQKPNLDIG